jgi:galactokinase
MWNVQSPPTLELPDLEPFLATLDRHGDLFATTEPITIGRAPGRLDLIGGIADYSGALVLELPLACATYAAVQRTSEPTITIRSIGADDQNSVLAYNIPLDAFAPGGEVLPLHEAYALLNRQPENAWAAYVLGPLATFAEAHGLQLPHGLRILIVSTVPAGKGVSSSAAIEVACLQAITATLGPQPAGRELAILCQRAENLVVGAPCGIMDQMTVACGEAGRLLALRCQPAELEEPVVLPAGLEVWGIDSGIRHAVGGSDYRSVRVGAFMGYRIIAELAGLPVTAMAPGKVRIDDPYWQGYLANIPPAEWERRYRDHVPEQLDGAQFLARYGGLTDPVTAVDPGHRYAVRQPTAHPIYEHQRVRLFRALLQGGAGREEERRLLGELMEQAHASYSACGLGSDGTDRLVDLVREHGPAAGVYGAKITGGGSGGVVAVLARTGSETIIKQIATTYTQETGRTAAILGGTSPGAATVGVIWAKWQP